MSELFRSESLPTTGGFTDLTNFSGNFSDFSCSDFSGFSGNLTRRLDEQSSNFTLTDLTNSTPARVDRASLYPVAGGFSMGLDYMTSTPAAHQKRTNNDDIRNELDVSGIMELPDHERENHNIAPAEHGSYQTVPPVHQTTAKRLHPGDDAFIMAAKTSRNEMIPEDIIDHDIMITEIQFIVGQCVKQYAREKTLLHSQRNQLLRGILSYLSLYARPPLPDRYILQFTIHDAVQAMMDLESTMSGEITLSFAPWDGE